MDNVSGWCQMPSGAWPRTYRRSALNGELLETSDGAAIRGEDSLLKTAGKAALMLFDLA